jgi:glycogen operon protein
VASINFVTCHDGFTLEDLVSYDHKHNEANGEGNRDGTDDNRSWNCGTEGPSADPGIRELRDRQKRNVLATLFCSQGVPMLSAGDELGRTQHGNNNAYCQDNEVSWVDWSLADGAQELVEFTRALSRLRREHPVFRRRRFFRGRSATGTSGGPGDIVWLTPHGREVTDSYWRSDGAKALAVFLNGDAISEPDPRGERITDDRFLLLFNASPEQVTFTLPGARYGPSWQVYIDTCGPRIPALAADLRSLAARAQLKVASRSVVVLCSPAERTVTRRS